MDIIIDDGLITRPPTNGEEALQSLTKNMKKWVDKIEPNVKPSKRKSLAKLCDKEFIRFVIEKQDSAYHLLNALQEGIPPEQVASNSPLNSDGANLWCDFGNLLFNLRRHYPALGIYEGLYEHQVEYQANNRRIHKGLPLFRMADCHEILQRPVHTKRHLMLTLIEDAISNDGKVNVATAGSYYRLVWQYGLTHEQIMQYGEDSWELYKKKQNESKFPEWVLKELDDRWMTETPQSHEMSSFFINKRYCKWLLNNLGKGDGKALQYLAHYLVACIPGCRAYHEQDTPSTDYDVVGIFEGPLVDFRSEIGRYFVCECKDYKSEPADFTALAKFCRVLDSFKAKFGVMVSRNGISGQGQRRDADLERLKVYQDRGIVIVVVDKDDLQKVVSGENFVSMLREKYMDVRLDLADNKRQQKNNNNKKKSIISKNKKKPHS